MDIQSKSKQILERSQQCQNEEATKQFLVLPFFQYLGYDIFNPTEVRPEHHADFATKNKNRVDYAIFFGDKPTIGIEVKAVGSQLEDSRGQLRGYFNALQSIKLGILTDGVRYECFADTDSPNMMDDLPFLAFDLSQIAENGCDENTSGGINSLRKENFDPANLGTTARQKLLLSAFLIILQRWMKSPSEDFIKALLSAVDYQGHKTKKVLDDTSPVVCDAFRAFIDREILKRVGINSDEISDVADDEETPTLEPIPPDDGIITTEDEIESFQYAKKRLAFMVETENQFNEIDNILYKDMKTIFKVFYKKPQIGILFNYYRKASGERVFVFPALDDREIVTQNLSDIDQALYESFLIRADSK